MATLEERIASERKRLRSVRERMMTGIERKSKGDPDYVPFYIAAANYIEETMQRVHEQDVKMEQLIRERVDKIDDSVEEALGELNDRLDGAKKHLKPFVAARDALIEKGEEALEIFEREGKVYSDFIAQNMGHHPPTANLGAKHFSPDDWAYMAGATDEEIAKEEALYDKFDEATPDDVRSAEN